MQYDQFIGQVQHRAHLTTREEAVAATRATLETLAERLGSELRHLVAQLPREIARDTHQAVTTRKMTLNEFFERISAREASDLPEAAFHARVVISVLEDAVTESELQHVRAQLPDEFGLLFAHQTARSDRHHPDTGSPPPGADGDHH